jgi:hypothetical protein
MGFLILLSTNLQSACWHKTQTTCRAMAGGALSLEVRRFVELSEGADSSQPEVHACTATVYN